MKSITSNLLHRLRWCLAFACLSWGTSLSAQQVASAEYFWDVDPGPGNGTALLAQDGNFGEAIETAIQSGIPLQSVGLHRFSVRFQDSSLTWGSTYNVVISIESSVTSTSIPAVAMAEYYWDTDPGTGSGIPLVAQDGAFGEALELALANNATLPAAGLHTLNVRIQDSSGTWGAVFTTVVSVESNIQPDIPGLVEAEYFWDTDPGQGNGTPLLALDGNFDEALEAVFANNVALPASGLHRLGVRVLDSANVWSPVFTLVVSVEDAITPEIAGLMQGEYFWDADPGPGNGAPILATDGTFDETLEELAQANIPLLASGLHTLNVRVRDDYNTWSPVFRTVISIEDNITPNIPNVATGEFFWDSDPGQGNGFPLLALDGNFDEALETVFDSSYNTFALSLGPHRLTSRLQDDQGNWGADYTVVVWIDTSLVPILTSISGQKVFCENDNLNGISYSVAASASNTYTWTASGGTIVTGQNTNMVTVNWSGVGTHTLSVQACDTDGCGNTLVDTIQVTAAPIAAINPATNVQVCSGEDTLLTAVNSAGSTLQWLRNGNPISGATGGTYLATISGNYQVIYTSGNSCADTSSMTQVTVLSQLQVNAGTDQSFCGTSSSVFLGGSPTAAGSQGPYTYNWTGSGLSSTSVANPSVTPTASGTYSVTVTDAAGCTADDDVVLTLFPAIIVNAGTDQTVCAGGVLTLGGSPTAIGGGGNFSYAWSPGTGLSSTTAANPVASVPTATSYIVAVTDANNCVFRDTINVGVHPLIVADAGVDSLLCDPGSIVLGGVPTGTGGNGALSYAWSPAAGLSSPTSPNPSVNVTGTQTYTVTITDQSNCQTTDQVTVGLNPAINVDAGNDQFLCDPGGAVLGGNPVATGGSGGFTYNWAGPGITTPTQPNPAISVNGPATYAVTVTDVNGCQADDTVLVDLNPALIVNAGTDQTVCAGGVLTLGGSPTAIGGGGNFSYAWSPGTGLSSTTVANPVASVPTATSYIVAVTDANNCVFRDTINVGVHPLIVADAGVDSLLCDPGSIVLGGVPTGTGGNGALSYAWSPAAGLSSPTSPNPSVNVTGTQTYTVTITDQSNCQTTDQVTVGLNPAINVDAGNDQFLCDPGGAVLGGNPVATGGSGGFTYNWTGPGITTPTQPNPAISVNGPATYAVTVTDVNGCQADDTVLVDLNPTIVVTAGNDTVVCEGDPVSIGGLPTASGGSGGFTYQWTPSGGLNSASDPNPVATPTGTTTYSVLVTDANNCTESDDVTLTVNPLPVSGFAFGTSQSTVTFANTSTGATTFFWDFGDQNSASLPSPTHTYQVPGIYTVCLQATNACGTDTFCQDINVNFVSVGEELDEDGFKVYPNPAQGEVYFEPLVLEIGRLELYNKFGQKVKEYTDSWSPGERYVLDLSGLAAGVYELRVWMGSNQAQNVKLMVNP